MKNIIAAACILASSTIVAKPQSQTTTSEPDKISYSLGVRIAQQLQAQNVDVNSQYLIKGINETLNNSSNKMLSQSEVQTFMQKFEQQQQAKIQEARTQLATSNKLRGDTFLSDNKKQPGVKTLDSGLQYKIITAGNGKVSPTATDKVTVHYKGTLIDGTEFDSSYRRNQPASFPVNGVIKGWQEALQLMRAGDKWQLFVPAELAYGETGAGTNIRPNETLIFEVELLSVNS